MELLRRIAGKYPGHARTWKPEATWTETRELPFYNSFYLIRVITNLSGKRVATEYADNHETLIFLDGSLESIYRINDLDVLQLSAEHIPAYLKFVFEFVDFGRLRIVESGHAVNWNRFADPADAVLLQQRVTPLIHPVQVSSLGSGFFHAVAVGIFENILVEIAMRIASDGSLRPMDKKYLTELAFTHSSA